MSSSSKNFLLSQEQYLALVYVYPKDRRSLKNPRMIFIFRIEVNEFGISVREYDKHASILSSQEF